MKYAITKIQSQVDLMTTRMKEAKEQSSDKEDRLMENNEAVQQRERKIMGH